MCKIHHNVEHIEHINLIKHLLVGSNLKLVINRNDVEYSILEKS